MAGVEGGGNFNGLEDEIGTCGEILPLEEEMALAMEPSEMPSLGWLDMTSELGYRRFRQNVMGKVEALGGEIEEGRRVNECWR